ncbi:hypothetical protein BCR39DRAFT_508846 [Naematelia encephala]|uniref:Small RNA 2'-O-methyltransferase n=1 Tax=Naematelia encephala TaxID=71784 RepID=A0A1Y2BKP6_9TREE|nr:hypothetical protein BCR39DRAFT_508846 [Naematelia encephala]
MNGLERFDTSPDLLSPGSLPTPGECDVPEVSMVEAADVTGVTFTPELWMQRRHWALEVLRRERVTSVLDLGCGAGALLETLVMPPSTIPEAPIRALPPPNPQQLPSPVDSDAEDGLSTELFIERLAGLDPSPSVIPAALAVLAPPTSSSEFPPSQIRWQPLKTELWLGGIEKYNSHFEGYEAITCMEVIEHLDPTILSRFGVVSMGTYRPRLLLLTTPNFDFNAKFPRTDDGDHDFARRGFVDPTGRTERVFRHSDHKLEMTSGEFREWALAAAADWGYEVELGGVGISSKPSYYPADDPHLPNRPVYATSTAIFRLSSLPHRSPRSVRSVQLPFMPSSSEASHPHKLAGKFTHPVTAPGDGTKRGPNEIRRSVQAAFERWNIDRVSLSELWGVKEISVACGGSLRYLVGCLGGWGDARPVGVLASDFAVIKQRGGGLVVEWKKFVPVRIDEPASWRSDVDMEGPSDGASSGGW